MALLSKVSSTSCKQSVMPDIKSSTQELTPGPTSDRNKAQIFTEACFICGKQGYHKIDCFTGDWDKDKIIKVNEVE